MIMGSFFCCSKNKGKAVDEGIVESANIEFNQTGVQSLDDFFNQAKRILDSFKDITGPLNQQKDNFLEVTGFYEVPGAQIKEAFLGMFLSLSALCNGEIESLKTQWGKTAPYVEIDTTAIGTNGEIIFKSFIDFINALQACITEKMPAVLEEAERLPNEADKVKDGATKQIQALNFSQKSTAIVAFGLNVKQLTKIPAFITNSIEGFKGDLQEILDAKDQVQADFFTFAVKGAECAAAGVLNSVGCYKMVYGPIRYTMAQR